LASASFEHSIETVERGFAELSDDAGVDDLAAGGVAGWALWASAAAGAKHRNITAAIVVKRFIGNLVALHDTKDDHSPLQTECNGFCRGSQTRHDHVIANEIMGR
jgi:hypothetical protein